MNVITIVTAVVLGGAAQDIELGFTPDFVKILNATDRTELVYNSGDTVNTYGMAIGATGTKAKAAAAANGLKAKDITYSSGKGITVGASATVLDTTADVLVIEAGFYDE